MSRYTTPTTELVEFGGETTKLYSGVRIEESNSAERSFSSMPPRTTTESAAPRRWNPGFKANLPKTFVLTLLGCALWCGACIGVVVAANRHRADSWKISPTVILAILGPLGSMMLQYSLSCGMAITWWSSALGGTTLGTLHNQWEHGTSVWASATSGRDFDRISLAKLMVLSVFAVNPLLQRALTSQVSTVEDIARVSTAIATDTQSMLDMNFTDTLTTAGKAVSEEMNQVIRQFAERVPITGAISGCNGNCSGTLKAAGFDARCTRSLNSSFIVPWNDNSTGGLPVEVFRILPSQVAREAVHLNIFYSDVTTDGSTGDCRGVATEVECSIDHAVVEYPFSQKDGATVPETRRDRVRILANEAMVKPNVTMPFYNSLSIAAEQLFLTSAYFEQAGFGWYYNTEGQLASTYTTHYNTTADCSVGYRDPTEDILGKLNEFMFRLAVAMPNASSPRTEFDVRQEALAIVYESRLAYMWAALGITVLAVAAVARTASGFQDLGRRVTLSPLEIANAFGSQLMREKLPGTSNMTVAELMKVYRDTQIQYASTDGDYGGAEDMEAGAPGKRMQMCLPGHGRRPESQELFTG
ncbi:hypothetical protein PG984_015680 [Apiospora sp. TS-2023a]